MKFGKVEIFPIETGRIRLDGGAMFGVIPKNLWSRTNPTDEKNRILMAIRCLLVKSSDRTVLIDCGIGDKISQKFIDIYAVDFSEYSLDGGLVRLGVRHEDVTDVILSHLHFDHVGGATRRSGDELALTFPNAMHHVQKAQWDWAMSPSERDGASYLPENYLPLSQAGRLNLLDGPGELFDGIFVEVVNGHTFGQQLIRIVQEKMQILYCADLIPMSAHVPAPYIMGYDLQPLVTLEEKKRILDGAVRNHELLFFEHDPFFEGAFITKDERGYKIDRGGWLDELL
jgi:glyoxylase-like metal-dependent hydrolase (beta-lactamase superfamily II)